MNAARLSALGRTWRAMACKGQNDRAAAICNRYRTAPLVGQILAGRGFNAVEAAPYLNARLVAPRPDDYGAMNQLAMKLADIQPAIDALAGCIRAQATVAIFADYDVDGASAAAILDQWLTDRGCRTEVAISCRTDGGFGPTAGALESLKAARPRLTVFLDCGTSDGALLTSYQQQDNPVAIIDHHKVPEQKPEITALVNPFRQDDQSGLNDLCTAGLVYMVMVATQQQLNARQSGQEFPQVSWLLDLVALATVCDMAPLHWLNRNFVKAGLRIIKTRNNPGLTALIDATAAGRPIDARTLGFKVGPCINAAGRIGDSSLGHRLLTCRDSIPARQLSKELLKHNQNRRDIQTQATLQALSYVDSWDVSQPVRQSRGTGCRICLTGKMIYLRDDRWHPGVVGLVAGKLSEIFAVPVLIGGKFAAGGPLLTGQEHIFGSARSSSPVHIGAALQSLHSSGILLSGGGHQAAGGFVIAEADEDRALQLLEEKLESCSGPVSLRYDVQVAFVDLSLKNAYHLRQLEPFGVGFPEPLLLVRGLVIKAAELRGQQHCRLTVGSGSDLRPVKVMVFSPPPRLQNTLRAGVRCDLLVTMGVNRWQDRDSLELILQDIRVYDDG